MALTRRSTLLAAAALLLPVPAFAARKTEAAFKASKFRKLSDSEWRSRLSPLSYKVLRHEATEVQDSSPLMKEWGKGVYQCLGCELPLFKSEWKYRHDGWPTFSNVIKANIGTKIDRSESEVRTEYHCARCLGHHGHIFGDGPKPLGIRYCNNGAALKFIPA